MSAVVHVIDDDEGVRDSIVLLLRTYGFEARAHTSAGAFLDELASLPPGCVVTDVQMPDMSGLDLLARLEPRRAEFPTIVLTGEGGSAMAREALRAGASDFLEKPFDGDAICAAIRRALDRAKA
jgi:two-component system response regulator FixJ